MGTAIESRPGTDPDRASFTTALETAKDLLVNAVNVTDGTDLVGRIGRAVLADLLPPRRPRTSVRKVKSPLSRYNKKDPCPDPRTRITSITATINDPEPKPRHANRNRRRPPRAFTPRHWASRLRHRRPSYYRRPACFGQSRPTYKLTTSSWSISTNSSMMLPKRPAMSSVYAAEPVCAS